MIKTKLLLVFGLIFSMLVSGSVYAAQLVRPDEDITRGGQFDASTGGKNDPFFPMVNEATPDDATTFLTSGRNASTIELGLPNVTDPVSSAGHIIKFRATRTGASATGELMLWQRDAVNPLFQIATTGVQTITTQDVWETFTWTLSAAEADAITDYNNLSLRLASGSTSNGDEFQVTWMELEVPDAVSTLPPVLIATPTFTNLTVGATEATATLGGEITNPGLPATITDCGVEWGTSPGSYGAPISAGGACPTGAGSFAIADVVLPLATTIYFRAWATNGIIQYSNERSFFTADPPAVTATAADEIGAYQARLGGDVTGDGGATVTARGIRWGLANGGPYPNTVPMGSGTGPFSQIVGDLPAFTDIYFVAYATNAVDTTTTGQQTFKTLVGLPTVDTPSVGAITATSAFLGGNVSNTGGASITGGGIVWSSTSTPPESAVDKVTVPMSLGTGTGSFSEEVLGLPTGTLVYFQAYATNSAGTAYSSPGTVTPAGPPEVDTPTVTNIGLNTADLGGNISSDGGAAITERGIVWDTASPPETAGTFVPNWSGLNPFSATIDGLPTGAPIFFRAYAKNISGTGYSDPVSSFSTLSQPTVQASNIAFPNASAKAIRITWTRGNGDGSIVVMRVGVPADPGIQAPADGDDYAFSTDYTLAPELPVNSQNYVVYKGPDSNIVVRGLTASTNYSVAIYEYGRLGANPDYLLTTPAEGSHATTDVPVHNMDNGVECDDCHSHGEWNPTRVGLITACQVCHNSSAPEAPNKLMFENHLTPSKNPSIDVVACGACHELHNPNINDTTLSFNVVTGATELNKSFLRANVDKYVSTASPPAYLHTDQPLREAGNPNSDPEALADTPDRAVEGGGEVTGTPDNTQATGYCQVCHTLTKYNRSTNLLGLVGDEGVSDQCHDGESGNCGPAETNCGECHQHKDGFQGIGGSQTCIECHSSPAPPLPRPIITTQFDRFTSHITGGSAVVAQPDCMVCHDQAGHPGDQIVGMRDLDDPLGTTLYEQPNAGFPTISTGEGEAFAGHCLSCHDADGASVLSGDVDRTPSSPFIGSGAPKIIDSTAWSTAGHNRLSATFPTSPVTCLGDGNNGCHASGHGTESPALLANAAEPNPAEGAAVNPTVFCYNCHDADGPSSKDIEADFNTATNFRVVSGSKTSALINQRHDISDVADDTVYPFYTDGDQTYSGAAVSCKDCHSPHVDNASFPVADPDTALPLAPYAVGNSYTDDGHNFAYDSGGDQDPINPEGSAGGFSEPDYIQFCLTCHDGTVPAGVTMNTTDVLLNIADSYDTDYHGAGVGSGQGTSLNKGALKFPWSATAGEDPATFYAAMNCTTCHGAHGSANIYNLRSSITVAGVQMEIGGNGNMPIPARITDPTVYDLPRTDETARNSGIFIQQDHYWGAWCSFCHDMSAHTGKDELGSCQGPHMHGGGSF